MRLFRPLVSFQRMTYQKVQHPALQPNVLLSDFQTNSVYPSHTYTPAVDFRWRTSLPSRSQRLLQKRLLEILNSHAELTDEFHGLSPFACMDNGRRIKVQEFR